MTPTSLLIDTTRAREVRDEALRCTCPPICAACRAEARAALDAEEDGGYDIEDAPTDAPGGDDPEHGPYARHPLAPAPMPFETARLLAHGLNRVAGEPAHVVNIHGHLHLAAESDMDVGMWPREHIVYTACASHVAAL